MNHSSYSLVGGIPVALIGIIGYLALLWLAVARQRVVLLLASLAGLGYALYLAHIERDVIGVWCLYCVISLGIITLIPIVDIIWLLMEVARRRRNHW